MHFGKQKTQNRLKNKKKRRGMLVFKVILLFLLLAVAVTGVGAAVVYNRIISEAPQVSAIDITPAGNVTFIYDDEGEQIQQLNSAEGNRISVSIEEIPTDMQHAIVAIEDARFYEHNGVDYRGMLRAVVNAVTSGFRRMEGASTITQQLLKNNVFTEWMSESTWDSIKSTWRWN